MYRFDQDLNPIPDETKSDHTIELHWLWFTAIAVVCLLLGLAIGSTGERHKQLTGISQTDTLNKSERVVLEWVMRDSTINRIFRNGGYRSFVKRTEPFYLEYQKDSLRKDHLRLRKIEMDSGAYIFPASDVHKPTFSTGSNLTKPEKGVKNSKQP